MRLNIDNIFGAVWSYHSTGQSVALLTDSFIAIIMNNVIIFYVTKNEYRPYTDTELCDRNQS